MITQGPGAWDRVLRDAAAGRWTIFHPRGSESSELPSADDEEYWWDRTIDAEQLVELICDEKSMSRKGIGIVGARIIGPLDLSGADVHHRVALRGCQFGGRQIVLDHCRSPTLEFAGSACGGLRAEGARIAGNLVLTEGFRSTGEVRIAGASIEGSLICDGARISAIDNRALNASGARIGGDVLLRREFVAEGRVSVRATIGGSLVCNGGRFYNEGGDALNADGAQIGGDAQLGRGFHSIGRVSLRASISGDLYCDEGVFHNPNREALTAAGARIGGGAYLRAAKAYGLIRLVGATIGAGLECDRSEFVGGASALNADRARIGSDVFLRNGFRSVGRVGMCATIEGSLICDGGEFHKGDGETALDADGARVARCMSLHGRFMGPVSLVGATAAVLADVRGTWPELLKADGFQYQQLDSTDRTWKIRREWLRCNSRPSAAPYTHLASIYRASGEARDARKILIEYHNALLKPPSFWREQGDKDTSVRRRAQRSMSWAWGQFLRATVGYGYAPWRILCFVIPLLLIMTAWYGHAAERDLLRPVGRGDATGADPASSTCTSSYTCVQPFIYAVDTLVPLVNLGQRSAWEPDQSKHAARWQDDGRWLAAATWVTMLLGWATAILVTASFSQAIKNE